MPKNRHLEMQYIEKKQTKKTDNFRLFLNYVNKRRRMVTKLKQNKQKTRLGSRALMQNSVHPPRLL